MLAELRNRGVADVLIACVRRADRLPGGDRGDLAEHGGANLRGASDPGLDAVHLLRRPQDGRGGAAADLHRPDRCTPRPRSWTSSPSSNWGKKYPATVRVWRDAWERFIPFLEFPPEVRKIIYTTNSIESLNYQLRKIIKNRGHFPNDDAVVKLLWLAIRDIEDKRARERAREAGRPRGRAS